MKRRRRRCCFPESRCRQTEEEREARRLRAGQLITWLIPQQDACRSKQRLPLFSQLSGRRFLLKSSTQSSFPTFNPAEAPKAERQLRPINYGTAALQKTRWPVLRARHRTRQQH